MDIVSATIRLYQQALQEAGRSFVQCWIIAVAVVVFAVLLLIIMNIAGVLGFLGGFLVGFANAFMVGWTLSLVEQAVQGARRLGWQDVWSSAGQYFGDVITLGFILWIPLQFLQMGMQSNPYGSVIVSAVFLLLFILLNPIPEVIYQGRHGSPLDAMKDSYDFVLENWIEWFLPLALVLGPLGLTFFFSVAGGGGRLVGLDFFQLLQFPFTVMTMWGHYVGLPEGVTSLVVILLTPLATIFILFFRGHLFAALSGTSRRQRLFKQRSFRG
jgi:hypothetical protein